MQKTFCHTALSLLCCFFIACQKGPGAKKTDDTGAILAVALLSAPQETPPAEEPVPVWADEFEGNSVDTNNWEFMLGDGTSYGLPSGWGNWELQYYQPENARVENGNLIIDVKEETVSTFNYTSARLRTMGKADFTYGRIEARMKIPSGQGIWPAFWMLPTDGFYGGWAASGEIDIMEAVNDMSTVHGTLHYGGSWPNNVYSGKAYQKNGVDFSQDFHVYAVEWENGEIRWYVDDDHYATQHFWWSESQPYPAPFDKDFHILLNVAVGGAWPGNPDATTVFPQQMVVDYVRVYELAGGDSL